MAKYRASWTEVVCVWFKLVWRPQLLGILLFEGLVFGFSIGINVTNAVFLGSPPPVGYGFGPFAVAGGYGTPIVRCRMVFAQRRSDRAYRWRSSSASFSVVSSTTG